MTDITYRPDTSEIVAQGTTFGTKFGTAFGTTFLVRIAAWCGQFADGACEGQQIAARYYELSGLSRPDLASRGLTRETMTRAVLTGH